MCNDLGGEDFRAGLHRWDLRVGTIAVRGYFSLTSFRLGVLSDMGALGSKTILIAGTPPA